IASGSSVIMRLSPKSPSPTQRLCLFSVTEPKGRAQIGAVSSVERRRVRCRAVLSGENSLAISSSHFCRREAFRLQAREDCLPNVVGRARHFRVGGAFNCLGQSRGRTKVNISQKRVPLCLCHRNSSRTATQHVHDISSEFWCRHGGQP